MSVSRGVLFLLFVVFAAQCSVHALDDALITCQICEDVVQTWHDRWRCAGETGNPDVVRVCDGPVFKCEDSPDPASCKANIMDFRSAESAASLWKALRREGDSYAACVTLNKCPAEDTTCQTALAQPDCALQAKCAAVTSCGAECYNCYRLVSEWPIYQEACLPANAVVPNELEAPHAPSLFNYAKIRLPGAPADATLALEETAKADAEELAQAKAAAAAADSVQSASLIAHTSRVTSAAPLPVSPLRDIPDLTAAEEVEYQSLALRASSAGVSSNELPLYSHQYGSGGAPASSLMEADAGEADYIRHKLAAEEALAKYRAARAAVAEVRAAKADLINAFHLPSQFDPTAPLRGIAASPRAQQPAARVQQARAQQARGQQQQQQQQARYVPRAHGVLVETDSSVAAQLALGADADVDSLPDPFDRATAASLKHAAHLGRPAARGFGAGDAHNIFIEAGARVTARARTTPTTESEAVDAVDTQLATEGAATTVDATSDAEDAVVAYTLREPRCYKMWEELGASRRARYFMSYKKDTMPSVNPDDLLQGLAWDAHSVCKCLGKCPMQPAESLQMAHSCKYTRAHEFLMKVAFPDVKNN